MAGLPPSTDLVREACARYESQMAERAFIWVKKSGGTSIVVSPSRMSIFQEQGNSLAAQSLDMDGFVGKVVYYVGRIVVPIWSFLHNIFRNDRSKTS